MKRRERSIVLTRPCVAIAFAVLASLGACDDREAGHGTLAGPPAVPVVTASATEDLCAASHRLRRDAGPPESGSELTKEAKVAYGAEIFASVCVTCHQPSGRGLPNAFPPLAGSDFLMADKGRSIDVLLSGWSKPITVNDRPYAASMPSFGCFSDVEVASVLTFARNSWGNAGDPVITDEVARHRARAAPSP